MNVTPLPPILIGASGVPLAQAKGSEVERTSQEAVQHDRQVQTDAKAESAAGIGTTAEQNASSDRDADGRRLWEAPQDAKKQREDDVAEQQRTSRDASGDCGTQLDLSG